MVYKKYAGSGKFSPQQLIIMDKKEKKEKKRTEEKEKKEKEVMEKDKNSES